MTGVVGSGVGGGGGSWSGVGLGVVGLGVGGGMAVLGGSGVVSACVEEGGSMDAIAACISGSGCPTLSLSVMDEMSVSDSIPPEVQLLSHSPKSFLVFRSQFINVMLLQWAF